MKKLLVIGAGIGQINIVKKAKDMGCHVTVVTIPGDWPAISMADDVWYIDIYDKEQITEKARSEKIDAVISDQNDLMMPTVAYVAEKLNLPGNTINQVDAYCNKNIFKDNCDRLGIPTPKHIKVDNLDYDFSKFDCPLPWIVKPADSQSSIAVKRIDNISDLIPALKDALDNSKTHVAIVEEFFFGKELVCEGFVNNGKYYNLEFADRKYFDIEGLSIPNQTLFPSNLNDNIKSKVIECERKMSQYINPNFAITHSEYLYDENTDEIRIIETALRGGGVFISSHLIPYSTGIDINDMLLKKALGEDIDVENILKSRLNKASGYLCFYLQEGTISEITGLDEIENMPFVKLTSLNDIKVGSKVVPMTYKGARKGPFIIIGSDRKDLEKNILKIQDILKIKVKNNGIINDGIIWE